MHDTGWNLRNMTSLETAEPIIRLSIFVVVFALFAIFEAFFPMRKRTYSRANRWPSNIGISALNQVVVRMVVPTTAMALAVHSAETGTGLLSYVVVPTWLEIVIAVLILDLALYLQHIMFHAVPLFWRLHRMHHADIDFDVTTGIRFHPMSIVVSAFIKLGVVMLLGPPVVAVLVFEVLLNATSLFNHSNLRIPAAWDRIIRNLVVTPDMHRVHHSIRSSETNSNFGFNFPWWDKLFGTYKAQPKDGHIKMTVGLDKFREDGQFRLDRMLVQPFCGTAESNTMDRREKDVDKNDD